MTEAGSLCRQVDENMGDIIEGVAPPALSDHVAACERCRDARYEAEQILLSVGSAADDYRFPEQLEERLMAALEASAEPAAAGPEPDTGAEPEAGARSGTEVGSVGLVATPHSSSSRIERYLSRAPGAPNVRWAWLSLAASLLLGVVWLGNRERAKQGEVGGAPAGAWSGEVLQVQRALGSASGLLQCEHGALPCEPVQEGGRIRAGARLETDGLTRARVQLDDGSSLALDRATRLALDAGQRRRARLLEGSLVAEIAALPGPPGGRPPEAAAAAVIDLPVGRVEVLGTKLAVRASADTARVEVSRGAVRLVDTQGRALSLQAGEAGEIAASQPPSVHAVLDLGQAFGWSSAAFEAAKTPEAHGALGELTAKRAQDSHEKTGAVRLMEHHIRVRIVDNIAHTEVEEIFTNQTDEVLEGIYRFPLPAGAQIERLALEVDGKLEEGAFVDRERAAAIWRGAVVNAGGKKASPLEEIIWVPGPWKDPALLEWQRGNRFELRIFPIPRRGSRRILLAYTEVLPPTQGGRQYVYPLPQDPRGSTRIERFTADIHVRGHDREHGVTAHGYSLNALGGSPEVARLAFEARDFSPSGDLAVAYQLENAQAALRAWAYQPRPIDPPARGGAAAARSLGAAAARSLGAAAARSLGTAEVGAQLPPDAPYVALALRPTLPRRAEQEARDYVLIVDTSRSMIGESYRRAVRVVARIMREMDRRDRVTLLACDSVCQRPEGGFQTPGEPAARAAERWLGEIEPEGASDLTFAIEQAAALGGESPARGLRIVYVGDGTPTVGPIHPALIQRAIGAALPRAASLHAVAIGSDADQAALRVATQAGGGVTVAFRPGESETDVVYALLGASYGHSLRNARLSLPEGMQAVIPAELGSIAAGEEALIVARLSSPRVAGIASLRGEVAGEEFEQHYPLEVVASSAQGNAFAPRLYAAVAIAELAGSMDESARRQSIELSTRFNVASRYTSLLVLESPAMFEAFGLDNQRRVAEWSGDQESDKSEAEAEPFSGAPSIGAAGPAATRLGAGSGLGAGDVASAAAPRKKAAPAARSSAPAPAVAEDSASGWGEAGELPEPELRGRRRFELPPTPPRRMIPMRRVWDRVGAIDAPPSLLEGASASRRAALERRLQEQEQSREALKGLYVVDFLAGDLERAAQAAGRWSAKDPLDVDALTARADLAAQQGQRDLAIRILGSVVDVRPGDHKSQWRLARLHRWAGRAERGCRHSLAVAQLMLGDAQRVAEAVACSRDVGQGNWESDLLAAVSPEVRREVRRLNGQRPLLDELSGDFRVRARWQGAQHDLDLVILHPEGYRVSWLGAPTRSVISATDVLSVHQEGLALRGATPGQYAVELVRSSATQGSVRGSIEIRVGGVERTVPFVLEGQRLRVASARIRMQSRLVPY